MDIQLPVMDSLRATRAIRDPAGRNLPMAAMAANAAATARRAFPPA
jgi:CheY-like chemotaxis protein